MNTIEMLQRHFLTELANSNASKGKDAPIAVVIRAKHDFNGMFSAAPARSILLQIAKTHRIAIKTIEDANQFGSAIRDARLEIDQEISFLFIMAHGFPDRIQLGDEVSWYRFWCEPFYQKKHILREDFEPLAPEAKIVLYSCNTGLGFAQSISNASNRNVYASMGDLWDTKTCLQNWPNQEIKIVSYNERNEQHIWSFTPNKSPVKNSLIEMLSEENKKSFSEMTDLLRESASRGDANAQWKLGMLYLLGIGTCSKSEKDAAYWLGLAAEQGIPQAQFELGNMILLGRGDLDQSGNEAGKWFSRSASKEFPPALFQMGICYLKGQCDFSQSDEKAAQFFTVAAKKGIPQALFNLGVLYEHGRGVRRSLNYAKHLYKISEGLGIPGSKERLINLPNSDSCGILSRAKNHVTVNARFMWEVFIKYVFVRTAFP